MWPQAQGLPLPDPVKGCGAPGGRKHQVVQSKSTPVPSPERGTPRAGGPPGKGALDLQRRLRFPTAQGQTLPARTHLGASFKARPLPQGYLQITHHPVPAQPLPVLGQRQTPKRVN